jgi:flagellar protein FlgJ
MINAPPAPPLAATVKHMAGMLWYEMLSELNKSGFSADALGAGSGDFQNMFLWNIAQNDFGKYDDALAAAATRQLGGTAAAAPAGPENPPPLAPLRQIGAAAITADAAIAAAPASTTAAKNLLDQATNYAKSIWPEITAAAQLLGVPPVAVLAQTALETGWGTATAGNNLFGTKALHGQPSTTRATHEMIDGVLTPQTAAFRDYPSTAASVTDYVGQIQAGFQAAVGQSDTAGFAQALQQDGYATDTNYAAKIISISQSPLMLQVLAKISGKADEK